MSQSLSTMQQRRRAKILARTADQERIQSCHSNQTNANQHDTTSSNNSSNVDSMAKDTGSASAVADSSSSSHIPPATTIHPVDSVNTINWNHTQTNKHPITVQSVNITNHSSISLRQLKHISMSISVLISILTSIQFLSIQLLFIYYMSIHTALLSAAYYYNKLHRNTATSAQSNRLTLLNTVSEVMIHSFQLPPHITNTTNNVVHWCNQNYELFAMLNYIVSNWFVCIFTYIMCSSTLQALSLMYYTVK